MAVNLLKINGLLTYKAVGAQGRKVICCWVVVIYEVFIEPIVYPITLKAKKFLSEKRGALNEESRPNVFCPTFCF